MASASQRVPPTSDEYSLRLSAIDFVTDNLHSPRGAISGLASVEIASCTTSTPAVSIEAVHLSVYVYICTCILCACVCTCVCIYTFMRMYRVCMCIHIHICQTHIAKR